MKTLKRNLWIPAVCVGVALIVLVTCLARKPTKPHAVSPVSDELQVFAAAVAPIGAIFTTIGVGVALFVAIRDSRRFAREEQLRHEQDTARRADQARLVQIVSYTKNQGDLRRISIELENLSDLPLLDVEVFVPADFEDRLITKNPMHPTQVSQGRTIRPVKPGEVISWWFWCDPADESQARSRVGMVFTDVAGARWIRTPNDQPALAPSPESGPV
ncbi:hypothetical protein RER_22770 [Rhodococcus erythropolis PR4]|uniref:Uncharacterized protein n=1 Tax=Rhodococcus erythropolis (strain PR4 / NBRC 100887) TaxID=234621 RepID=C0ZXA0_RHOE4|nr:hypothetical protein RER_22770 [Rhodococcus erythropolis PR4]